MDKKSSLALMSILAVFLVVGFASATVTLQAPASDSTVSGNSVFWNASVSGSFGKPTSCSLFGKSDGLTANTTFTNVSQASNESSSASFINGTFDSNVFEDTDDQRFYANCTNSTGDREVSSNNTNIVVDNTVPQTPTSLNPSDGSTNSSSTINFTATVSGPNTTSCTLTFTDTGPGQSSYSMTHTGDLCYKEISSISDYTYDWEVTASDETNTSKSSTNNLQISSETAPSNFDPNQKDVSTTEDGEETKDGGVNIPVWVWIVGAIVLTAIVLAGGSQKRK